MTTLSYGTLRARSMFPAHPMFDDPAFWMTVASEIDQLHHSLKNAIPMRTYQKLLDAATSGAMTTRELADNFSSPLPCHTPTTGPVKRRYPGFPAESDKAQDIALEIIGKAMLQPSDDNANAATLAAEYMLLLRRHDVFVERVSCMIGLRLMHYRFVNELQQRLTDIRHDTGLDDTTRELIETVLNDLQTLKSAGTDEARRSGPSDMQAALQNMPACDDARKEPASP